MGLETSRVRAWRVSRVCVVPGAYAWARPKPRPLRTRSAGRRRGIMMPLPPAPSRLDRIRIDRTHTVDSIDPVNPVYIYKVEQIHAVDWDRRRRFQSTPICSKRGRASESSPGFGPARRRWFRRGAVLSGHRGYLSLRIGAPVSTAVAEASCGDRCGGGRLQSGLPSSEETLSAARRRGSVRSPRSSGRRSRA